LGQVLQGLKGPAERVGERADACGDRALARQSFEPCGLAPCDVVGHENEAEHGRGPKSLHGHAAVDIAENPRPPELTHYLFRFKKDFSNSKMPFSIEKMDYFESRSQ